MTELPTATQFVFFYIGQIIAFSLCFIIIEQITRPVVNLVEFERFRHARFHYFTIAPYRRS